jgi:hypothetical protein
MRRPARPREVVRPQAGEHKRPAEALGFRHVVRVLDEGGELGVRERMAVDPERIELDPARRSLAVAR